MNCKLCLMFPIMHVCERCGRGVCERCWTKGYCDTCFDVIVSKGNNGNNQQ